MKKVKQKIWIATFICLPFLSLSQEINYRVDTVVVITYKINGRTATGYKTTKIKGKFVAISPDLLEKYPLKSKIRLSDCRWKGVYRVMDIMGKRHVNTVDIYYKGRKRNKETCICNKID